MRAEAATLVIGAAVAAVILASRALLPEAPGRVAVPGVEALEGLSTYLASDTARPSGTEPAGVTRLARDPFTGRPGRLGGGGGGSEGPGGGTGTTARVGWSVSAIMISDSRRLAIIDDRLVEAGDTLPGGARVVEVARDHVLLVGVDGVRRRVALNR